MPLQVIIVGAGLAGLASGIALRKQGHIVNIYEKSKFTTEIGAAISLSPNANRVLAGLGWDIKRVNVASHHATKSFLSDAQEGGPAMVNGSNCQDVYEHPMCMAHRADIHKELTRLATDVHGIGPPCTIHLGSGVIHCDVAEGSVTLSDQSVVRGDLVIGADGINSFMREHVLGQKIDPQPSGLGAYRVVIRFQEIANNPKLSYISDDPDTVVFVRGKEITKYIVFYPCRGRELQNIVAVHQDKRRGTVSDLSNISAPSTMEAFLDSFSDYAPRYLELVKLSKKVVLWPLLIWDELPTWTNGRTCILGDAAHAMFPILGQGISMGLEDVAALGALFPPDTPSDFETISSRLRLWESIRKPRVTKIQSISNRMGRGLPGITVSGELETEIYGYDAEREARMALEASQSSNEPVVGNSPGAQSDVPPQLLASL
ncbi:FAD/NAD(P)-binding domain-containing protein [Sistotremastrum suecicum HHB10207 ss-3]|uniref:FAD/NAD(P)-binding domain-containing protein n=1 Tax=Sistotremastrum suecicum HHB10207 ss-3 TaxID=1314776 RepID=A0A165Y762_9AGAM|nr:FAD/NAD(P)-binding domain-containing protein [Sistotremastrum suecicum HHB10207 ss-3]